MTSKFGLFSKKKMDALYLTGIMQIEWLYKLYEYWDEEDTAYSDDFGFWPEWFFKYDNKLTLGEAIEIAYIMWKSEQHIPTPKYNILCSLVPLVKQYFVTMEDNDNQWKIICQCCNDP